MHHMKRLQRGGDAWNSAIVSLVEMGSSLQTPRVVEDRVATIFGVDRERLFIGILSLTLGGSGVFGEDARVLDGGWVE
jgi:hypothetical protein